MKVLDEENQRWFLLQKGNNLFLNVLCNNSAAYFNMLIKLEEDEHLKYEQRCRDYLNSFARDIQYYSFSKFQNRDFGMGMREEVSLAIATWNYQKS